MEDCPERDYDDEDERVLDWDDPEDRLQMLEMEEDAIYQSWRDEQITREFEAAERLMAHRFIDHFAIIDSLPVVQMDCA